MALLSLIFGEKRKAQVGVLQFDASLSETHSRQAEITEHPIEEGANPTDHIRRRPAALSLTGIVSDTPLVYLASLQAPSPLAGDLVPAPERVALADAELQRIMDESQLVTVVTTLREYENMALESFEVTRNVANANVLAASLSLREVIVAKTETVAVPEPETAANAGSQDLGTQASVPAGEGAAAKSTSVNESVAHALFF